MAFAPNRKFKKRYDKIFRKDPLIERGVVAKSEEIERIASALEVNPDDLFSNGQVKNYETDL